MRTSMAPLLKKTTTAKRSAFCTSSKKRKRNYHISTTIRRGYLKLRLGLENISLNHRGRTDRKKTSKVMRNFECILGGVVLLFFVGLVLICLFQSPPTFNSNIKGFNHETPTHNNLPLVAYFAQNWNQTWGGTGDDEGRGVAVDGSGNAFLVGHTSSYGAGGYDAFLAKYGSTGTQLWNLTIGGAGTDSGQGVALDGSGNAFLAGYTNSYGAGGYDGFLAKYGP